MARKSQEYVAPYVDPMSILTGRMYLGSFDDSVSRHGWLHTRATASALTRHLLLQSMLGPPVCFRIGNLLYHDAYFEALRIGAIPIIELARTGFVQIHTKGATINKTIALRQKQGTNSTEKWIRDHNWSRGSDVYREMTRIDRQLKPNIGKRQYSPSFNKSFGLFAKLASQEESAEFQRIYKIWLSEGQEGALTRSDYERICERVLKTRLEIKEAMSIINSVNHYAYGVGLFKIERQPLIDTSEIMSLRRYTTGFGGDDGRPVKFDVLDELIRNRVLTVISEGLSVAEDMLHPGPHWARYAELLDLDNTAPNAVAFRALKVRIVDAIRQCVNGNNLKIQRVLLKENCEEFSAVIRKQIGSDNRKENNVLVGLGVRVAKYVAKKVAFTSATGGGADLAGLKDVPGVDIVVSMIEDGASTAIERIQDSVSVPDAPRNIRDLLPITRSALSWRYMDRRPCEEDGLL